MAAGDIKLKFAASAAFTQTNLDGLATSATWVAGWESNEVDNSVNLYEDYLIAGEFKVESSGLSVGEIRVHVVAEQSDAGYPDVFDGTESVETVTSAEIRDKICKVGTIIITTTDVSRVYPFGPFSVARLFGGICPRKFVIFVAQSTGTTLEDTADPNQVYYKGVYRTVAQ